MHGHGIYKGGGVACERLDSDAGRCGRNTGRGRFGFAWLSWFLDQTTSVTINQFETEAPQN